MALRNINWWQAFLYVGFVAAVIYAITLNSRIESIKVRLQPIETTITNEVRGKPRTIVIKGVPGPRGPRGPQGPPGGSGPAGSVGTPGRPGGSGGRGVPGPQGAPGRPPAPQEAPNPTPGRGRQPDGPQSRPAPLGQAPTDLGTLGTIPGRPPRRKPAPGPGRVDAPVPPNGGKPPRP